MALVKCNECGNEVSTKATACPKCGAARPKPTSPVAWLVVIILVLSFVVVPIISGMISLTGQMIDKVTASARGVQKAAMSFMAPVLPKEPPAVIPKAKPVLVAVASTVAAPAVVPQDWKQVKALTVGGVTLRLEMTHDQLVDATSTVTR